MIKSYKDSIFIEKSKRCIDRSDINTLVFDVNGRYTFKRLIKRVENEIGLNLFADCDHPFYVKDEIEDYITNSINLRGSI